MTNPIYQDFADFLKISNEENLKYLIVGGYTVIGHGYDRSTGDIDIWVEISVDNYKKLTRVFYKFGLPIEYIPYEKFIDSENFGVFSFGRSPVQIEILTEVKGLNFEECFVEAIYFTYQNEDNSELKVRMISYHHLIKSKLAAGRKKDLADIENLEANRKDFDLEG